MENLKVYVDVAATFSREGMLIPMWIIWENGKKYPIDKVKDCARMANRKAGGAGIRYLCSVGGHDVELFYEENYKWFLTRNTAYKG